MIGAGSAPCAGTVKVVEAGTFAVTLFYNLLCLFGRAIIPFHHTGNAVFHVGSNKHIDATRIVAQHIVGTASYEDARMIGRSLAYGLALYAEEVLVLLFIVIISGPTTYKWYDVA